MHSFHPYHCHLYRWIECIPGRTQQNDGPRQGKCDSSCLNLFTVTVSSEKGTRSVHNALPAVAGWQCCSSRSTALRRPRYSNRADLTCARARWRVWDTCGVGACLGHAPLHGSALLATCTSVCCWNTAPSRLVCTTKLRQLALYCMAWTS